MNHIQILTALTGAKHYVVGWFEDPETEKTYALAIRDAPDDGQAIRRLMYLSQLTQRALRGDRLLELKGISLPLFSETPDGQHPCVCSWRWANGEGEF